MSSGLCLSAIAPACPCLLLAELLVLPGCKQHPSNTRRAQLWSVQKLAIQTHVHVKFRFGTKSPENSLATSPVCPFLVPRFLIHRRSLCRKCNYGYGVFASPSWLGTQYPSFTGEGKYLFFHRHPAGLGASISAKESHVTCSWVGWKWCGGFPKASCHPKSCL